MKVGVWYFADMTEGFRVVDTDESGAGCLLAFDGQSAPALGERVVLQVRVLDDAFWAERWAHEPEALGLEEPDLKELYPAGKITEEDLHTLYANTTHGTGDCSVSDVLNEINGVRPLPLAD